MLRERIEKREKLIGTHIHLTDVTSTKLMALANFDYIWIDEEHSYKPLEDLLRDIIILKAMGVSVIVRAPQDDLTYTKKILEMGVDGIIFPQIRTAEQANKLISYTLYPPYGIRGFGPGNAIDYGYKDAQEYVDNTTTNVCRFIQIEHIDAVKNLDEIMKNDYIDGYIFGAHDLSGSINELGNVYGENNIKLIKESIVKLKAKGKYIGLSTTDTEYDKLKFWFDLGIDMISSGSEFYFIQTGALRTRNNLDQARKDAETK